MIPKIKICGITNELEATWLLEEKVEYAGIVLFYELSKRNNSIENAKKILLTLKKGNIKTVAVTVSPTKEQVEIVEELGFHYLQVHGELSKVAFDAINIPMIRAFQVTDEALYEKYHNCHKIMGYLYDGKIPGSGETFDWSLLGNIKRDEKQFFLAGGLSLENINEAIEKVNPDVVDVSSGVEFNKETVGKDPEKIREFVRTVRDIE